MYTVKNKQTKKCYLYDNSLTTLIKVVPLTSVTDYHKLIQPNNFFFFFRKHHNVHRSKLIFSYAHYENKSDRKCKSTERDEEN